MTDILSRFAYFLTRFWHSATESSGVVGSGWGTSNMASPNGIEVDSAGRIYVADSNNHRIQVFTQANINQGPSPSDRTWP